MGAYQKGGEKSIQFSNRSTARQMVRSEISMITRFAAHHFQKARLWTPSSFRVFHLWRALQEILMPSHVCPVWASLLLQCHPPSPLYPYRPYASTALIFPLRRSFCRVTIASSTTCPHVPQRGRRTGAGAAFQPLAISPLLMRLHQSVLHSSTQQKVDIA